MRKLFSEQRNKEIEELSRQGQDSILGNPSKNSHMLIEDNKSKGIPSENKFDAKSSKLTPI